MTTGSHNAPGCFSNQRDPIQLPARVQWGRGTPCGRACTQQHPIASHWHCTQHSLSVLSSRCQWQAAHPSSCFHPHPIMAWPGSSLLPFPWLHCLWYRTDTLWLHQRRSFGVLQSKPRCKSVTSIFWKASFQFSHGWLLLGNLVSHYAHPDVHDNMAVLSQSRYALLRGDQMIPDQGGECHTSVCWWC